MNVELLVQLVADLPSERLLPDEPLFTAVGLFSPFQSEK